MQIVAMISLFMTLHNMMEAERVSYKGHQLWRIRPKKKEDLEALKDMENTRMVETFRPFSRLGKPDLIHVPRSSISYAQEFLNRHQIDFEVTVENLESWDDQHHRRHKRSVVENLNDFNYSIYHTYEEIGEWMNLLTLKHNFIAKDQIGVSFEGRALNILTIRKPGNRTNKPAIFLEAMTHAREWITTASLLFIWNEILTKTENRWMIEEVDWYFLPVVNVDGYIYTWKTDRLWRKTRQDAVVRAQPRCFGVDSNRNWDSHWSESSSDDPCAEDYHGPFPASESEVRHEMNFIRNHKDQIKGVLAVHSYGQLLMYPYGYQKGVYTNDYAMQHSLVMNISNAMYNVHHTYYTPAQGAEALSYDWSGNTVDWCYDAAEVKVSLGVELRDHGEFGFFLPPDQIIPTGEELLEGMKVLARYVSENY